MLFRAPLVSDPVFAVGYAVVSVFLICINLYILIVMMRTKQFCPAIPLFGGLYGAIAMVLFGGYVKWLFWVPLVLDWGCLVIVISIYKILMSKVRSKGGRVDEAME